MQQLINNNTHQKKTQQKKLTTPDPKREHPHLCAGPVKAKHVTSIRTTQENSHPPHHPV
jgi:hypothetical protein